MVQNGKPLGQMLITLGLDTTAFSSSLTGATRATKTAAKEMQAGFKIADAGGKKIDALAFKQQALNKVIEAQKNELGYLKQAYDKTLDSQGNATSTTAKAAQKYNDAQAKLAGYQAQLQSTAGQLARLQVETQGVTGWLKQHGDAYIKQGEKIQKFGGMVSKAGTALTVGVTAPIVAGATAVTKAAIDWESAFAGVKKTSDEVIDSNGNVVYSYDDLEASLRGLAKELPSTHSEIAAVAEAAGQLGIQTQDITAFTKTMIDMGESTNLSAEDAATAIAKIANITGMTSSEYQRFGSSVVALGNNFATTEADIVQMSNRLASAGTLAGLSNQEILGLATAMSSVGIEAEAGGTAMTQTLTAIEKAAVEGGDSLDQFAKVAGMSSSEFAKQWNEKPIEAIQSFIKGLGELDGKGESATLMLDEMGLSGVRQSNMLKSLALASDTLSGAVDMSTQAWEENTALTNEAGTRYETTESKLKMLRNEAVDAAIEFGGPLVDALRDGLEASKPLIKSFGDMAKAFSSLDKEQQQNIIKWGLMAAAAGPALKLLGGGISTIGSVTKGVGKLSTGIVELVAASAEKKALATLATSVTGVGTAASGAAGSAGVGAMTTALGASGLAGALPLIVGAGGLLAVGYGAWKLFGEEAWNSSQRVQRWGTDVGEAVDGTLTKVQDNTQKASGQFGLMADGFATNSDEMISNFEKIGQTIEDSLVKKVDGLKKLMEELPKNVDSSLKEMITDEQERAQNALEIVQSNSARITDIRNDASKNNREISAAESKIIKDLAIDTTQAYVETLDVSANEKKKILDAMNADVASATEEEAKLWLQSLGKQRQIAQQNATLSRQEKEEYLKELGYSLDGEFAQKYMEAWDEINSTTVNGFDSQMETILKKYPELQNEVSLANGQLISSMGDYADSAIAENEKILSRATDLSNELASNAKKNADKISWTASESSKTGKKAAQIWNDLVFDEKTGEVKSNAAEVVTEAAKDSLTWNNLKLVIHDADLDSNAKLIIGEAAIANGWWEGMSWDDKKLIVNDEATSVVLEALQNTGIWQELSLEEKTALLYSNTPEKMRETLVSLGLWDKLEWKEKTALLESNLPDTMHKAIVSNELWGNLTWEDQQALLETNVTETTIKALEDNGRWQKMTWEEKLMVVNSNTPEKVASALFDLGLWEEFQPQIKDLGADNYDLLNALSFSKTALNEYNDLDPEIKRLIAEDPATLTVEQSKKMLQTYNDLSPELKRLLGENTNVNSILTNSKGKINDYNATKVGPKHLHATADYSEVLRAKSEIAQVYSKNVVIDVEYRGRRTGQTAIPNAKGTNYHPGGDMIVNDQSGPLYKELVQFPGQAPFIPQGRNVYIPNAPAGTKVARASITKSIMRRLGIPKYADGVGIPEESSLVRNLRSMSPSVEPTSTTIVNTQDYSDRLDQLIKIMKNFDNSLKNLKLMANNKVMADVVNSQRDYRQNMLDKVGGK